MTFETNGQWAQTDANGAAVAGEGGREPERRGGDNAAPAIAVLALLLVVVIAVAIALT